MKKLLISIFLMATVTAMASTTTVTATLTDTPDTTVWTTASWSATLISSQPPTINGVPVSPTTVSGVTNSSGVLSTTLTDTSSIDQKGAVWQFTLCSNTSTPRCPAVSTPVIGASQSLSTILSANLPSPRFSATLGARGYADVEVLSPQPGQTYTNVTASTLRQWSGTAWGVVGSGTGGGSPSACTGGNNYGCLNTSNIWSNNNVFNGGTFLFSPTTGSANFAATSANSFAELSVIAPSGSPAADSVQSGTQQWQYGVGFSGCPTATAFCFFDATNFSFVIDQGLATSAFHMTSAGLSLTNGLQLGVSQYVTGYQGTTGTKLAATTGTFTSGNVRSTDSSGNEIDGGVAATSIALKPGSNANTSATGGTGISAVSCSTASCTNLRGTYTMSAATVSAGTILTLVWPTTTTAYACQVVQNGGAVSLGLGHSVATATGMTVSVAVSVATGSITFDYECTP